MTAPLPHIEAREVPDSTDLSAVFGALRRKVAASAAGAPQPERPLPSNPALAELARIFLLNQTEVEIMAMVVGADLDQGLSAEIAKTHGSAEVDTSFLQRIYPTAWEALCPEAPLRHWRLLSLIGTGSYARRPLLADERILHFILGATYRDTRLEGILEAVALPAEGEPDAARLAAIWRQDPRLPVISLAGPDRLSKRRAASEAARLNGCMLYRLDASDIPETWAQRASLAILIDRELALSRAAVLIEADDDTSARAARFAERITGPTMLSARDPEMPERAPRIRIDMSGPDRSERLAIWQRELGDDAAAMEPRSLERLAEQFTLDASGIATAAGLARMTPRDGYEPVWAAARSQARRGLDNVAERVSTRAGWTDLVLPDSQTSILRDLEAHVLELWTVREDWGWETKTARGLGTAVLFSGSSGTGKTFAAEILAKSLSLDLFRIDLSQVVSKYIGETEKNLSRIFSAANAGGAVLLFDEADALFGKRSEVKDSHDRYANVEVSYLLQEMEAYRGLAVLTTNQKSSLDQAFLRRLRYAVSFPFPDARARQAIWQRIFPAETPLEGLDFEKLSQLNLTGGSIRSIALNASFLAAGAGEKVTMQTIRRAAAREYAKLEKSLTPTEARAFE